MRASVGDRLHVRGKTVGESDQIGRIIEVKGVAGAPPYVVRFEDGHTGLVFPGPDAVVEPAVAGATTIPERPARRRPSGRR